MNTNCAIDLVSPERLQRIRELAQKATPGPWIKHTYPDADSDYREMSIVAKSRAGVLRKIARFDYMAKCCGVELLGAVEASNADCEYIIAVQPAAVIAMCREIERLRRQAACLEKEADWLAERMPKMSVIDGKAKAKCLRGMKEWREAACKAVEEEQCKK